MLEWGRCSAWWLMGPLESCLEEAATFSAQLARGIRKALNPGEPSAPVSMRRAVPVHSPFLPSFPLLSLLLSSLHPFRGEPLRSVRTVLDQGYKETDWT